MATAHVPGVVLADRLLVDHLGAGKLVRDAAFVTAAVGLTAACAQAEIPWDPVPFTLQTLAVPMTGLLLGAKRGLLSQLIYLGLGAVGLPVLSGGGAGVQHFVGPTAGYLVSFPIVAYALGVFAERRGIRSTPELVLALIVAHAVNLGLGSLWVERLMPDKGWSAGFAPFILGGMFKSLLAAAAVPELDRRIR